MRYGVYVVREGTLVWPAVCSVNCDCSKESYEPVNQKRDALIFKAVDTNSPPFQTSSHTTVFTTKLVDTMSEEKVYKKQQKSAASFLGFFGFFSLWSYLEK